MKKNLNEFLKRATIDGKLPSVIAYNRIDGPGSSLDLREFQEAFWRLCQIPVEISSNPTAEWSKSMPRTIGITIDSGIMVEARPLNGNLISVKSEDYNNEIKGTPGKIYPQKKHWLLKAIEIFGLSGVQFVLANLHPGVKSSGLGGSATATTAVCILANALADYPFSDVQIIAFASLLEQDFGVSITGTQEQSNVLFGGVTDYVWFPWGIPGTKDTGYGSSKRFELIPPEKYNELEKRMALFHTGIQRSSSNVNSVWRKALRSKKGFLLHKEKVEIAYIFRESLRKTDWVTAILAIENYRKIRTLLCSDYMTGSIEMLNYANKFGCTVFPLGAGGGGVDLVFGPDPEKIEKLKKVLKIKYNEIQFKIKDHGYDLINISSK